MTSQRASGAGRGMARSLADYLEIPPELAAAAGAPAVAAMTEIKHGVDAGGGDLRQVHLAKTQQHMAGLDPRRHGTLLQHLQARVVELGGRRNTQLAHVTPGEVVVTDDLMTPEIVDMLRRAAREKGLDPERFIVGSGRNSINPNTGKMEFDDFFDQSAYPGDFNFNAISNDIGGLDGQDLGGLFPSLTLGDLSDPSSLGNLPSSLPFDTSGYQPNLGNLPAPSSLGSLPSQLPPDFPSLLGSSNTKGPTLNLGNLPGPSNLGDLPGQLPSNFPSILRNLPSAGPSSYVDANGNPVDGITVTGSKSAPNLTYFTDPSGQTIPNLTVNGSYSTGAPFDSSLQGMSLSDLTKQRQSLQNSLADVQMYQVPFKVGGLLKYGLGLELGPISEGAMAATEGGLDLYQNYIEDYLDAVNQRIDAMNKVANSQ